MFIDIVFATQLLKSIENEEPSTTINTDMNDDCNNYDPNDNFIGEETLNETGETQIQLIETQENEASLYRWSPPCVLLLLETYRSMEGTLKSGKLPQKKVWESIAQKLIEKGYHVTGGQCSSKLRSLKKTYKSIKDYNNKSGNDKRSWQFFEIMEEIFAKKAWCNPVAVASSSGLSSKQLESNNSMEESDGGCSSKSNKNTITYLLGKRLKQREEHEQFKMKRHEERMEMDKKLLQVLEKLADK